MKRLWAFLFSIPIAFGMNEKEMEIKFPPQKNDSGYYTYCRLAGLVEDGELEKYLQGNGKLVCVSKNVQTKEEHIKALYRQLPEPVRRRIVGEMIQEEENRIDAVINEMEKGE